MTKFYIGFGILTAVVIAVAGYGIVYVHSHPVISPLDQARAKSRDARRLADVRQIMTGLELYYNDCEEYPTSLRPSTNNGCPAQTTWGTFMAVTPTNPTPGGTNYVYNSASPYKTYTLTFTLEAATGGFAAGEHTASPTGLK